MSKDMHRLVVDSVGPGFRDRTEVLDEDPSNLMPRYVECAGITFERYGDDDDFVEFRLDYVVARARNVIKGERDPGQVQAITRLGPGPVRGAA